SQRPFRSSVLCCASQARAATSPSAPWTSASSSTTSARPGDGRLGGLDMAREDTARAFAPGASPRPFRAPRRARYEGRSPGRRSRGVGGEALANGFLAHGHEVMRGSRDVAKLAEWTAGAGPRARAGTFAETAAFGELVVLAVKGTAAEGALRLAGPQALAGKI